MDKEDVVHMYNGILLSRKNNEILPFATTWMDQNIFLKMDSRDFPGGTVVKNPPANAGDTGSSPGPGRSHVPWSN